MKIIILHDADARIEILNVADKLIKELSEIYRLDEIDQEEGF